MSNEKEQTKIEFDRELTDKILNKALIDIKNLWGEEFLITVNMSISRLNVTTFPTLITAKA